MNIRLHIIYGLLIAASFGLGIAVDGQMRVDDEHAHFAIREYDTRFPFIRPLLICQMHEDQETDKLKSLEKQIQKMVQSAQQSNRVAVVSVYYRDLNSGRWVGVNELDEFEPASLLKVPLMMAYFKESEDDPSILSTARYYVNSQEPDPLVTKPLLVSNKSYTTLDLIRGMIVQSDNQAMYMLRDSANTSHLKETYNVLEINDPFGSSSEPYQLSAKKYGLFFRVLYNGTFLNREKSDQALELLSQSEFALGLRAGIPANIIVAHKHGVRGLTLEDGSHGVEVSDCGIVYNPASPYLLCVMTRGSNAYVLSDVIKNIAETVYRDVVTGKHR